MELYLRDQATILADVERRLRDTANARWLEEEIYRALNDALTSWHGRVSIPNIYTFADGFTNGDNEYALPSYVNTYNITPQMKRTAPFEWWGSIAIDDSRTWVDIPGYTVEPDGLGGQTLRFDIPPFSTEGRLIWYGVNAPVPLVIPTTSGSTAADATSLLLGSLVDCVDHGFVKVGAEWMQYSGVTRAAGTTTLLNLIRGYSGGTAGAVHADGTSVYWGVAMPRFELYRTLLDQLLIHLYELYLSDGASRETQAHQQMVSFYAARIDKFWRTWTGARRPRLIIDRRFVTME